MLLSSKNLFAILSSAYEIFQYIFILCYRFAIYKRIGMEHSAQDVYEMHVIVKGKVQGVGLRAMTHYYATNMGITGTVAICRTGQLKSMRMDLRSAWKNSCKE